MSVPAFLESEGYRRVALARTCVGHFETGGTLAGTPVRVLIDTGAASTVVSFAFAQELKLKMTPLGGKGGGAGGAQIEIFRLEDNSLRLDHALPRPTALFAMDLAHVNAALALKGAAPVEVILGADVFERQAAIIDYGSSSLFLKDADLPFSSGN